MNGDTLRKSQLTGGERMLSNYTMNQKRAIITMIFAAIWALVSLIIAIEIGLQSNFALVIFGVMTLIAWIMILLYVKKIKVGFVLGIVLLIFGLDGLFASPGDPPWYTFTNAISIVKELPFVLDAIACVYFSYKSYREV
ncbi:MAG: hypothetical protein L6N94_06270 [Candidatus Methylarchaceae archaeon HK01M]|nr:hypothetical protein [Candidatus Methylarchaceae archaeon HK01M]